MNLGPDLVFDLTLRHGIALHSIDDNTLKNISLLNKYCYDFLRDTRFKNLVNRFFKMLSTMPSFEFPKKIFHGLLKDQGQEIHYFYPSDLDLVVTNSKKLIQINLLDKTVKFTSCVKKIIFIFQDSVNQIFFYDCAWENNHLKVTTYWSLQKQNLYIDNNPFFPMDDSREVSLSLEKVNKSLSSSRELFSPHLESSDIVECSIPSGYVYLPISKKEAETFVVWFVDARNPHSPILLDFKNCQVTDETLASKIYWFVRDRLKNSAFECPYKDHTFRMSASDLHQMYNGRVLVEIDQISLKPSSVHIIEARNDTALFLLDERTIYEILPESIDDLVRALKNPSNLPNRVVSKVAELDPEAGQWNKTRNSKLFPDSLNDYLSFTSWDTYAEGLKNYLNLNLPKKIKEVYFFKYKETYHFFAITHAKNEPMKLGEIKVPENVLERKSYEQILQKFFSRFKYQIEIDANFLSLDGFLFYKGKKIYSEGGYLLEDEDKYFYDHDFKASKAYLTIKEKTYEIKLSEEDMIVVNEEKVFQALELKD